MGKIFSAPVQTVPGAHAASLTIGTGLFLEVKRPRRGVDHPYPSRAEIKKKEYIYTSTPLLGFHGHS